MSIQSFRLLRPCVGLVWWSMLTMQGAAPAAEVSFSRDIQPVLARNCFACHGPDEGERQAELRLDLREAAVSSGAIIPGAPEESELIRRIFSTDPEVQMPPPRVHAVVTDAQKELLRQWIAAGAAYEPHWAFELPRRTAPPRLSDPVLQSRVRNAIDSFVWSRLEREGRRPSPEADRYTLIRRVSLDLIGLPPSPEEADAFVRDEQPLAYERLVDRLLHSPHYGERWARPWLDLARYADSNGYEKDRPRSIWPYRDWVITALNADMPYDQFSIEQLAGDLLPDAGLSQRVATGFHRNTMLNEEGGIDPLEYRFYAMVDRVATTGTVWLGLTTGCAQCHAHKYDPISHTDYYRLMALLNNADEPDLILPDPDVAARRAEIAAEIARLEAALPEAFPPAEGEGPLAERRRRACDDVFTAWLVEQQAQLARWTTLRPFEMTTNLPRLAVLEDGSIFSTGDITKRDVFTLRFRLDELSAPITALRLEVLPDDRLPARGPGRCYYEGRQGDFFLSEVTARHDGAPVAFGGASHSYGKISIGSGTADAVNVIDGEGSTGWSTSGREGEAHELVLNLKQPLPAVGVLTVELLFERHFAASLGRFRLSATSSGKLPRASELPPQVQTLLLGPAEEWSEAERETLRREFLRRTPLLAKAREPIEQLRRSLPEFPTTLVFTERPVDNPRPTHRHHRGEYLSPRETVEPGLPAFLLTFTPEPPRDRLALARWLVSRENPLAARVAVNQAWRLFFGRGLVETAGDFGTQADPPSHPELLDYLACEFMDRGWSLKELHRQIVTSGTYRQSSAGTPEQRRDDPDNRLLARGPRHRLEAEIIRDALLAASGLLSSRIGGPSVFPPQPASVTALAYGNEAWQTSTGEDRYRRSLYTYSKRTAPFAAYAVFDAPSGEGCVARRDRSNSPLQALTLLNDAMFLEFAQALAANVVRETGVAPADQQPTLRATAIFRRLLTRPPTASELAAIVAFYQTQRGRLEQGALDPATIAGQTGAEADLAAWVMTARAVMNLDETVVKP
jgi:mono/diheme cytochrome c family protein